VALALDAVTNRIYVVNSTGDSVSVIDGASDSVVKQIPLVPGSQPSAIAVDSVANRQYVVNSFTKNLAVIVNDAVTKSVNVGNGPAAVVVNPISGKIYVANLRPELQFVEHFRDQRGDKRGQCPRLRW
jgi:YVTN family beta-propeller protein